MTLRQICASAGAAFLLFALPAGAQTEGARPGWIAASHTGCKIWNPAPQPEESVTWSGGCKNGFAEGEGVLQWFEQGKPDAKFEGAYQGGKRNGYGILTDAKGNREAGEWRNDEPIPAGGNEIDFIERP
jgi:hypothetical protein